ncbi:MAG TPA: hypothetical protein ENI73_03090 [Spirochaetes bacterium]|nr:hypothetical protein [Spirochaetota bacterium]
MKEVIIVFVVLMSIVSAFSLDFYSLKDKKDKDHTQLYSPRKEVPVFTIHDLMDLKAFANQFIQKTDPNPLKKINRVAPYLYNQLSGKTKGLLKAYTKDPGDLLTIKSLKVRLVEDLNRIVKGKSLYTKKRFKDIPLSSITGKLLSMNLKGKDLAYLNYFLIQDAFPKAIIGWRFFEESLDPTDPKLYEQAVRPYWRRKIGESELPYPYIERQYTEDTQAKDYPLQLIIKGQTVGIDLKGTLTPRPTGLFYHFPLEQNMAKIGHLTGEMIGRKIGQRVNLSVQAKVLSTQGKNKGVKLGDFNGSITFDLKEDGRVEKGYIAFFARFKSPSGKMDYLRMTGSIKGSLQSAGLTIHMIDVDGRDFGTVNGAFRDLKSLLLLSSRP